jgi:group I intron endonuclease
MECNAIILSTLLMERAMRNKLNCGIYRILNNLNGDFYVGQSIRLSDRKNTHFSDLKANRNRMPHLQNAWNKYGGENFIFEILLFCDPENLTYYEQTLVDNLNPKYNICIECVDSPRGTKRTPETLEKMRKSQNDRIRLPKQKFNAFERMYADFILRDRKENNLCLECGVDLEGIEGKKGLCQFCYADQLRDIEEIRKQRDKDRGKT